MAKKPSERKRDQRERDNLIQAEKEAALLSRRIVTKLYYNDDAVLERVMAQCEIDEKQDLISRLIRGADCMSNEQLADHIRIA